MGEFGEAQLVARRHVDERHGVVARPFAHPGSQPPERTIDSHITVCVTISGVLAPEIVTQTPVGVGIGVGGGDDLGHEVVGDGGHARFAGGGFGHHEVAGVRETVQHGVRQPRREVGREVVVEHRVVRAPGQQHRDGDLTQPIGDRGDGTFGRVAGVERDVSHEVGDGNS